VRATCAMNPPAKASPAPVGSNNLLQRVGGDFEHRRGIHEQRAMLALLDHHHLGAASEDPVRRPIDVPVARELARFRIVHHQDVDMAKQLEQQILLALNPVVHRIAGDQLGLFDLNRGR